MSLRFLKFVLIHAFVGCSAVVTVSAGSVLSTQTRVASYALGDVSAAELLKVSEQFEIKPLDLGAGARRYQAFVPQGKIKTFLSLAPYAQLLEADTSLRSRQAFQEGRAAGLRPGGYHSFDEVVKTLNNLATQYPKLVQVVQYGWSKQKRPLMALRVSKHFDDPKKPRVMLTAATHGDEIITTEILLNLMSTFLQGAERNPRFAEILGRLEIVFIPVVNPDGFSEQSRYDEGEDPNRYFPYPTGAPVSPTASSLGMMNFVGQYPIVGSIDFHAYGRLVMYPWGYTTEPLPAGERNSYEIITARMAQTNHYENGQISKIIYVAKGSSVDYYFWKLKSVSLGIEVGDDKAPRASLIPQYTQEQTESTWLFLDSFK